MTGRIRSINTSAEKGARKKPVPRAELDARGIVGDAHAGPWRRQISLLARESVERFEREAGIACRDGDFAENLTTEGLDLAAVALGDRFASGGVELETTQIGKACHGDDCAIHRQVGRCVMPREGLFARVLRGGALSAGDPLEHRPRVVRVRVITVSDRASRGEYEDRSGPAVEAKIRDYFASTRRRVEIARSLVPDEPDALRAAVAAALREGADALVAAGGTGIGPRDVTPDVIAPLLDKTIPGLMEFIRVTHGERLPSALLSRSVAGVAGTTLVYAIPGSVHAALEHMDAILPTLEHSLLMLWGIDAH